MHQYSLKIEVISNIVHANFTKLMDTLVTTTTRKSLHAGVCVPAVLKKRRYVFGVPAVSHQRRNASPKTLLRAMISFFLFFFIFQITFRRLEAPVRCTVFDFISRHFTGGSKRANDFSIF